MRPTPLQHQFQVAPSTKHQTMPPAPLLRAALGLSTKQHQAPRQHQAPGSRQQAAGAKSKQQHRSETEGSTHQRGHCLVLARVPSLLGAALGLSTKQAPSIKHQTAPGSRQQAAGSRQQGPRASSSIAARQRAKQCLNQTFQCACMPLINCGFGNFEREFRHVAKI